MEEVEHRRILSEIRKAYHNKQYLTIDSTRLDDRNEGKNSGKPRPKAMHYMMTPNGDIAFKVENGVSGPEQYNWSTDKDLISQHHSWFNANRNLLSLKTFIGKTSKPGWKYSVKADQDQGSRGLLNMPLEVFENLVWYVDGFSFYNLCKASPILEVYLNEALNDKQYDQYWELRKNDVELYYAAKIISSFSSKTKGHRLCEKDTRILWPELFKLCLNLNDVIEESTLCLESLFMLENSIKTEMQLGFMYTYPQRFTFPCGSMLCTLYNDILNEYNDENIIILEDMDPKKAFRMGTVCNKQIIQDVHVMRLMKNNNEVVNLIITVCCQCVCVYPVMEGNGLSIPIEISRENVDAEDYYYGEDSPPPAFSTTHRLYSNIYRDVVGIIVNVNLVELYRISYVGNQVFSEQLHKIQLEGFDPIMEDLQFWRKNYMITVSEIDFPAPMSSDEKCYYETAQIDPPLMKAYGLSIISFHLGHFLIRPNDIEQTQSISFSSVCKMSPIYYKADYESIESMKYIVGSCSDYGMHLFWSDEAMAVSFDSVTWHLKSVYDGVRLVSPTPHEFQKKSRLPEPRFVISVKICSPDLILVAIDKQLVFLSLRLETYKNTLTSGYPRLMWDVIRRIDFDLLPLHLSLRSLYFDFVRGDPYIFVELHDANKLADPLKFSFKRILLELDKEKDKNSLAPSKQ